MKSIEFPTSDKSEDEKKDILEFLDEVKAIAEEEGATEAVVIMMNEEGQIGMSVAASYLDATAMLAIAMKSF